MNENTANITLSNYKDFKSLIADIEEASKKLPSKFSHLIADIYVHYKYEEDEKGGNTFRVFNTIETSDIEEAILQLRKLVSGDCVKVTLDVSLEKPHTSLKEYHTCIYYNGTPQLSETLHNSSK